jgi:hypothetical protein
VASKRIVSLVIASYNADDYAFLYVCYNCIETIYLLRELFTELTEWEEQEHHGDVNKRGLDHGHGVPQVLWIQSTILLLCQALSSTYSAVR